MEQTHPHVPKAWQLPNNLVDKFRDKGFAVILELVWFQPQLQLFLSVCGINDAELSHEHDPSSVLVRLSSKNKHNGKHRGTENQKIQVTHKASIIGKSLLKLWDALRPI